MTRIERGGNVEQALNALVDNFLNNCGELFHLNGRFSETYEQGRYSCAILKPSKRMRLNMGVDREIILVSSTFREQQQRTIKFIQRQIENSEGRLERTLCIVIHLDPEGNSKLRNWGRDVGISVLPIDGRQPIVSGEDLQSRLANQLFSHDPFDVTGPVSDDANFYGRRDEAIDLARKLQSGQIRSCLGIRKIGKTSIINRIISEIQKDHRSCCVMIDCSRDDIFSLSATQLIDSIACSLAKAVDSPKMYVRLTALKSEASFVDARDRLEDAVMGIETPILVIFDEVDYITPGSPTNNAWRKEFNPFWRNLRAVYQESDRRKRRFSILVGGVSTYWFTTEAVDGVENAALSFIPEEFLTPMPEGATVAMLRRLGRVAGLEITEDAAKTIARETGNMPFWSRKCCSYIHRRLPQTSRPLTLERDVVIPLIEAFVIEEGAAIAEVALSHLFRVHPLLWDAALKIDENDSVAVPQPLLRSLRRYGVTSRDNEFSGSMISQAFKGIVSSFKGSVSRVSPAEQTPQMPLEEWAEELATLGKRRNLLERRMRDVVLNFLRLDALSNGDLPSLKIKIMTVIPQKRRDAYVNLSLEDIMQKLLWTELTQLITRHWRIFEKVFINKSVFDAAVNIVNDRPDAHAKNRDAADFALYRRNLELIEENVQRLM